ncbi:MAG: hypothetical protein O9264_01700 [Leptospira sp.]|nr:hypothetical protein [Leptospira sp.]
MKYLKKKFEKVCFLLVISSSLHNCFNPNQDHYNFWKSYYSQQQAIRQSTKNYNHFVALTGAFSKERERDFKTDQNGHPYIELVGIEKKNEWQVVWYPEQKIHESFHAKVTFIPLLWETKEIYAVEREITSNWSGYQPRDFFNWLNQFSILTNKHSEFITLRESSPSFKFLCETFLCNSREEATHNILEFTFTDKTESKFPTFYQRAGGRLEKTHLDIRIWDTRFPKEKILISNQGKTLQFKFPINAKNDLFKNPKTIHINSNILIKSFGITFEIHDLLYELTLIQKGKEDILVGKFLNYGSKNLSGNFFYFIPTGFIDFFIPGNIEEYLNDALTLMVYGTQGKGGAQFRAIYNRNGSVQKNYIKSYSEIMRSRFSLFGADSNQMENPSADFFGQWESALLKDLKRD